MDPLSTSSHQYYNYCGIIFNPLCGMLFCFLLFYFFHKHGGNIWSWKQNMEQEENKLLTDILSNSFAS